jgi:protein SCO1/2
MRPRLVCLLAATAALLVAAGCGAGGNGGGTGGAGGGPALRGTALPDEAPAPDFSLRDQDGRKVTMQSLRGDWTIVTFLYTACPDVCPVIAGNLNAALRSRAARRANLHVLAVSVDPKRDTQAAVRRYARRHRLLPTFRWLIGSRAQLAPVWRAFNVAVLPDPGGTITHSAVQLLVDPEGRERVVYDSSVQASDVTHDLNLLLEED